MSFVPSYAPAASEIIDGDPYLLCSSTEGQYPIPAFRCNGYWYDYDVGALLGVPDSGWCAIPINAIKASVDAGDRVAREARIDRLIRR